MNSVRIVEVGLRDGLQNESQIVPIGARIEIAERLFDAGIKSLEVAAFVREDRVPQMKESGKIISALREHSKKIYLAALVPNEKGMDEAVRYPLNEIALFTAASNSFCKSNINCTIEESFARFKPIVAEATKRRLKIRGYLSTAFGCPYEGRVSEAWVLKLIGRLLEIGCYEVSVGDTIGVAGPAQVRSLFSKLKKQKKIARVAGHFHDTRGLALANIMMSYEIGVRTFDSSIAGLGGCPYAPGASGNVATEEVVALFEGMKVKTGIDLQKAIDISKDVSRLLGRDSYSKIAQAGVFRPKGKIS